MRVNLRHLLVAFVGWLLLGPAASQAQPALVGTLTVPGAGYAARVVPTADGGWFWVELDSLKILKLNRCGQVAWARQYRRVGGRHLTGLQDVIGLRDGGLALLTRAPAGARTAALVVRLDPAGAVRWSRLVGEPDYDFYPYTLGQTRGGEVVLYANVAHLPSNTTYSLLVQLDGAGNLRWARRYDLGRIWGGALLTADGGILARSGWRLFRTDSAGAVQWATQVVAPGMYSYYAPAEVADGFVFTSQNSRTQAISFYKLDRQGQLLGGARRQTELHGRPPTLRPTATGHLLGGFNLTVGLQVYPTVIEFDSELRIVRQRSLNAAAVGISLSGLEAWPLAGGGALLTGFAGASGGPDAQTFFFARTDSALRPACDTLLAEPADSLELIVQLPLTVSASPIRLVLADQLLRPVTPGAPTTARHCFTPPALDLGPDTVWCGPAQTTLRNRRGDAFDRYEWSTGATTPTLTVRQPGRYWLRAVTNCGQDTLTDSVRVTTGVLPELLRASDTVRCSDAGVVLDAQVAGPATYRWSDGSVAPQLVATDTGRYYVDISAVRAGACSRRVRYHVSECERLLLPNVFTPNADGRNDRLVPIEMRGIAAATLTVYSRWGQRLSVSTDLRHRGWDGTAGGQRCAAGTYFWVVRYTTFRRQQKLAKGYVELVAE